MPLLSSRTSFFLVAFNYWRPKNALFICILGLKFLNTWQHKVFACLYQLLRLCLMRIVVGCDQVGDSYIILRESCVLFVKNIVQIFLIPFWPEGVSERTNRVHRISRSHLYHMVLRYAQFFIIVRRADWTGKLSVAFEIEILGTIDSLKRWAQTLRKFNTSKIHRQTLLKLSSSIIIILSCEIGVKWSYHIAMGVGAVLRSSTRIYEVTSIRCEIVPT